MKNVTPNRFIQRSFRFCAAFDKFVSRGIADLRRLMGLPTATGSSVGAAVRGASFTNVEDFQRQMFAKAFSLGSSSPEERTAGYAEQLLVVVKGLPEQVWNFMKGMPADTARKLWEEIQKIPGLKAGSQLASGDFSGAAQTAANDAGLGELYNRAATAGRKIESGVVSLGNGLGRATGLIGSDGKYPWES